MCSVEEKKVIDMIIDTGAQCTGQMNFHVVHSKSFATFIVSLLCIE